LTLQRLQGLKFRKRLLYHILTLHNLKGEFLGMESVNNKMIERVTSLLKNYKELKLQAQLLAYEIENHSPVASDDDVIDVMTLGNSSDAGGTHVKSSKITDKTAATAIAYVDSTKTLNAKDKKDMAAELRHLTMELMRLEYYIELLGGRYASILTMHYIEGLTYMQIMKKLNITNTTLKRQRKEGICKLAVMYELISNDTNKTNEHVE
jgi:hypothetical protein